MRVSGAGLPQWGAFAASLSLAASRLHSPPSGVIMGGARCCILPELHDLVRLRHGHATIWMQAHALVTRNRDDVLQTSQ